MKRIGLFLLTNIAVIAIASIVLSLLGVGSTLQANGVDLALGNLLIFAAVFGFAGSFVSLALSKFMAKKMTGAQVIENPRNADEQWLVDTVRRQAEKAGIGMPEVAIYNAPDPNAFATGMSKNKALVAVSTGLLRNMTRNEVEAVLGHEVAHIANGDMITMALVQGVVNTFVIFFARIAGHFVDRVILKNESGHGIGYFVASFIFEIIFGILASIITMWFSRRREFHADNGGAYLAGKENMIAALRRLQMMQPGELPDQMAAFGISNRPSKLGALFMSHPPLEDRIAALEATLQEELKIA
ncbi:protease HtpX [Thiomicrospira cyclica]|uniref:Protease HtpX n=1 Tax=Thiomicrospira cyclica (strain DSM 14477 / JCM 11371 / ALM1) TaxID=717773 RepID=F6D987_THICA|nr:protease HtpX [Thiomicrospira cyclica]AEG32014.1 protease htpX [Thiomicrospira cyclica ALM1]